jgi:hypothetical protein
MGDWKGEPGDTLARRRLDYVGWRDTRGTRGPSAAVRSQAISRTMTPWLAFPLCSTSSHREAAATGGQ